MGERDIQHEENNYVTLVFEAFSYCVPKKSLENSDGDLSVKCKINKTIIQTNKKQKGVLSHLFEVLEGELVHRINLRETGDDKVQDRASSGHGSVALPCRVDHQLSSLRLL